MNEIHNEDAKEHKLVNEQPPMTPETLFSMLDKAGIQHHTIYHPPLRTVEDAKAVRPDTDYGHTKNLFVRNKKGAMWLLSLHEDRVVDLKQTAQQVGAGRFSFASSDRLMKYLGVIPGAVSPFSILNDMTNQVTFMIDEALMEHPKWHIHPLDNTMTTTIDRDALLEFLKAQGHEYRLLP